MYSNVLGFMLFIVLVFGFFFFFKNASCFGECWGLGFRVLFFFHLEMISLATKERADFSQMPGPALFENCLVMGPIGTLPSQSSELTLR